MSYGEDINNCIRLQQRECFKAPCDPIRVYDADCVRRVTGNAVPWWWKMTPIEVPTGGGTTATAISTDYKPYLYAAAAIAILVLGYKMGK